MKSIPIFNNNNNKNKIIYSLSDINLYELSIKGAAVFTLLRAVNRWIDGWMDGWCPFELHY